MQVLKDFVGDESGATAIEYGMIATGIAIAIVVSVRALGIELRDGVFTDVQDVVQ